MELNKQQQAFSTRLRGKDINEQPDITWIGNNSRLPAHLQLQVYCDSSLENIVKALLSIFPTCVTLVGEVFFQQLLREYVMANPCCETSYIVYAKEIPDFILSYTHASTTPYLADVARLDWAWDKAYFCATEEATTSSGTMSLNSAATLIASSFPLLRIWRACQPGYNEAECVIESSQYYFVVWPCAAEVAMAEIKEREYAILSKNVISSC